MKEIRFPSTTELTAAAKDLILETVRAPHDYPAALVLAGGKTPLAAYEAVAQSGIRAADDIHMLFSDERMVPIDSPDSNYRNALNMIRAIGIPDSRVLRVQTELSLDDAARQYDQEINEFLSKGGRVELGLLGLGADGHTASLFAREAVAQTGERWAIPVPRSEGHDRVSVTRRFLLSVKRIVFLVAGPDKQDIVEKLLERPETVVAGMAVKGAQNVELWIA